MRALSQHMKNIFGARDDLMTGGSDGGIPDSKVATNIAAGASFTIES